MQMQVHACAAWPDHPHAYEAISAHRIDHRGYQQIPDQQPNLGGLLASA